MTHTAASAPPRPPAPGAGTSGGRIYRPELDALRFFAFFCVYLHHTMNPGFKGGIMQRFPVISSWYPLLQQSFGFGLCLFFFLSSYLITSLLRIELARTGTVDLRKFYVRRILRIWPLYLVFLLAISALGIWWPEVRVEPWRLVALLLLSGNWYSIVAGHSVAAVVHLWSISVEEQFYLVWPSISRRFSVKTLYLLCAALCLFALLGTWLLFARGNSALNVWLNSIPQSLFFASGALLSLAVGMRAQKPSLAISTLCVSAGLAVWVVAEKIGGLTDHFAPPRAPLPGAFGYALAALGCALILWGFLHLPSYLLIAPLLYLGRISYGLYVYHELFLVCTRVTWGKHFHTPGTAILTAMMLTIAASALSYQFLEKPFLKLKSRFELIHTRVA